jgi:hypothetical protein
MIPTRKPLMAKAHSKQVADEYLKLGWTLCSESRVAGFDEPAEYYFEWQRADAPMATQSAPLMASQTAPPPRTVN